MKKLMLFVFLGIFLVLTLSTVSAAGWDNKLTYENDDLKVIIDNLWNLPIIGERLGTVELKSHKTVDEERLVGRGSNITVMYYEFNFSKEYVGGLGNVEFTNVDTGKKLLKNYYFARAVYKEVEKPIVKQQCNTIFENETSWEECGSIKTGTKIVREISKWEKLNDSNIPPGKVTIGLVTDVNVGDKIDGVWKIAGKRITKHSIWTESLNLGLLAYYAYNHSNGTTVVVNQIGNTSRDGIVGGGVEATAWVTGLIGNAFDRLDGGNVSFSYDMDTPNGTINFWMKRRTAVVSMGKDEPAVVNGDWILQADSTWRIDSGGVRVTLGADTGTLLNEFVMMTLTWRSNNTYSSYINGTKNADTPVLTARLEAGPNDCWGSNMALSLTCTNNGAMNGSIDEWGFWNRTLTQEEINQLFNNGLGITFLSDPAPSQPPVVNLNNPINNSNLTSNSVTFSGVASDDINLINVSLFLNGVLNQTNSTPFNASQTNFTLTLSDGTFDWFYEAFDSDSQSTNSSGFRFIIDTVIPFVNITAPIGTINFHSGANETLNWTVSDVNLDTCFFDYNNINTTVTCNANTTSFILTDQRNITFWANDTHGNTNNSFSTWDYLILERVITFNSSSFETAAESFIINITTNGTSPTSASLFFDNTENTGTTIINTAANNFTISKTIAIPTSIGTKNHFFNILFSGININSTTRTQVINATNFTLCNAAPQNIPYINFSFRNETLLQENVTATIDSTWTFSLGALSIVNKTLVFLNATENNFYAFCNTPGDRDLNIDVTLNYNNDISQQRSFVLTRVLSSVVTNQVLFLLPTSLGLFSQFVTVDTLGRVIPSVKATVTRIISGVTVTIASGFTDGSGFISFFTNPDVIYTGTFEKSGFTTESFTFTPVTDLRTVTMAATSLTITNGTEITLNTTYQITPINTTLQNNTNVTFGFNVTSEQEITFISLNITNSTGHQLGFASATSAGFISDIVNTSANTKLIGTFILNTSTESITLTKVWLVGNFFTGDYSIFRQLTLYNTYGFKDFFRLAMVLFVIFGTLIFMTRKEITDTGESKIMVVTLLIWAFSIVGWLDSGLAVNSANSSINQISGSANQFGIAIIITIGGAIFFVGRRIFIRRP